MRRFFFLFILFGCITVLEGMCWRLFLLLFIYLSPKEATVRGPSPEPFCLVRLTFSIPFLRRDFAADRPSSNAAVLRGSPSITRVNILLPEDMASFPYICPISLAAGDFMTGNKKRQIPFRISPKPAPLCWYPKPL